MKNHKVNFAWPQRELLKSKNLKVIHSYVEVTPTSPQEAPKRNKKQKTTKLKIRGVGISAEDN